jgi:hypothetical protein
LATAPLSKLNVSVGLYGQAFQPVAGDEIIKRIEDIDVSAADMDHNETCMPSLFTIVSAFVGLTPIGSIKALVLPLAWK